MNIINKLNNKKQTALYWAIQNKNPNMVTALREKNADVTIRYEFIYQYRFKKWVTPLYIAAHKGFEGVVLQMGRIDALDKEGTTALHEAVGMYDTRAINILLENSESLGLNVNALDEFYHMTALQLAVRLDALYLVTILLEHEKIEKNIDWESQNGQTAFMLALQQEDYYRKPCQEILELLEEKGADIKNAFKKGKFRPPLVTAAEFNRVEMTEYLLNLRGSSEALSDTDESSKAKYSPLQIAVYEGHWKIIILLLQDLELSTRKSLVNAPIHGGPYKGKTALEMAQSKAPHANEDIPEPRDFIVNYLEAAVTDNQSFK